MKKNKIYLVLSIIFFFGFNSFGQLIKKPKNLSRYDHQKIHFGFTLGINELNFKLDKNSSTISNDTLKMLYSNSQKGFNLGIVTNIRLNNYLDLRFIPALVFGERHLHYRFNNDTNSIVTIKKIESTLLDFPIHVKYKSNRYNNVRTYLICGLKYSLDIASQDNVNDEGQKIVKLKKNDLLTEIGFGLDFYLEYFKFSPQIKLSYGLLNLLSKDSTIYTETINNLTTNGWMISFTFE